MGDAHIIKKMECQKETNLKDCTCTYPGCPNKGMCCKCIREHRERGELPGCLFPSETEKTFDRSIKAFVTAHKKLIE